MNIKHRSWWGFIVLLLLVTFALRVWALDTVPPGLTHDEASNGHDSAAILRGVHRIYFPVGYGHEPLYDYSVAALTLFLGQGIFTLRLTTVIWSLLTWTLTVALARRWWGRRAAIFAGAAFTVSFWALMMARVGLRAPTLPALLAASALAYDHALTTRSRGRAWRGYLLAGLFLGAGFYTYMASRGMPALYLMFLVALALFDRATLRKAWAGTLALIVVAGLVGLPLLLYLNAHPELEQRLAQLGSALTALKSGDWRPLWQNVSDSLPMLLWKADPRWLYNIGGRPALEPLPAGAFLAGVAAALRHLKDRRNVFLLLWLAGGLAPALLATVEYNTLHAIAAMPAVILLAALGIETLWQAAGSPCRKTYALLVCGFLITGVEATQAYFVTWGQNRDVRVLYHHHIVALGRTLEASPERTPVVVTSIYPGEFHDPYTMEVTLRRDDLDLRWANGQSALFFPAGEARLYTELQSAPHPTFAELIQAYATPAVTLAFRPDDIPPAVDRYRWDAGAAWSALTASLMRTVTVAPGDAPPSPHNATLECPAGYGGIVSLVGYRVTPPVAVPGDAVEVLTAWAVQAPHPAELVLFTHLLDAEGHIVAQADRLDAPSWQWQAGDRFAQVHTLTLPQDVAPGSYGLATGFYTRADVQRLPVDVEPGNVNRVLLPFDIKPPDVR